MDGIAEISTNCHCSECDRVTKHYVLDVGVVKALKCSECGEQSAQLVEHGHDFMVLC